MNSYVIRFSERAKTLLKKQHQYLKIFQNIRIWALENPKP
jgi:hypothetical protein